MKFKTKDFIIFLLFFQTAGATQGFSQSASIKKEIASVPVDSTKFYFFKEYGFDAGVIGTTFLIQNSLDGFQNYRVLHPNTGNAGAPEKKITLPQISKTIFSNRGNTFFLPLFNFSDDKNFYKTPSPYTKIQLILGQKQELNIGIIHAHQFGDNCNVALGFNRIRSAGFYQRQNTNNTNVNLNGWYRSPGRRYALVADLKWTTIDVQENGGIANDSDFLFRNQLDRRVVAVNLYAAETRQQVRSAWVNQYWAFGEVIDTLSSFGDSLPTSTKIFPNCAIVHNVSISDESYVYQDDNPQSGFYPIIFKDSIQTLDSTNHWKLANGLWIERFQFYKEGQSRKLFGKVGLRHELGTVSNDTIQTAYSNFLIDGIINFNTSKKNIPEANVTAWTVFNGYNKGDYFLSARIGKDANYEFVAEQKKQRPDFIYSHYSGNHFGWVNDFYSSTQTNFSLRGWKTINNIVVIGLVGGFHNYNMPIYFDENKIPSQFSGSANAVLGQLILSVKTKKFKSSTNFTYNKLSVGSPIRLPEFIVRESVYGDFCIFKKALQLQVGLDATYFSAYFADAYNPNLAQFYIQNSNVVGNYIFLSPWLSIKIKPVRVFVKADHLNAGMMGRNYIIIPHYPQNDFVLKFGLAWVFND